MLLSKKAGGTLKKGDSYAYDAETGAFTLASDDEEKNAVKSAMGDVESLLKVGEAYYLYNGMKLTRKSGTGLNGTFEFTLKGDEKLTDKDKDGNEVEIGTASFNVTETITITDSGIIYGNLSVNDSVKWSDSFKQQMIALGMSASELADITESATSDIVGMYVNNGGLLTVRGTQITTQPDENGNMITTKDEFDNGSALYTGDDFYFADILKIVTSMQGQ